MWIASPCPGGKRVRRVLAAGVVPARARPCSGLALPALGGAAPGKALPVPAAISSKINES